MDSIAAINTKNSMKTRLGREEREDETRQGKGNLLCGYLINTVYRIHRHRERRDIRSGRSHHRCYTILHIFCCTVLSSFVAINTGPSHILIMPHVNDSIRYSLFLFLKKNVNTFTPCF